MFRHCLIVGLLLTAAVIGSDLIAASNCSFHRGSGRACQVANNV